jgi:hypothetical protein
MLCGDHMLVENYDGILKDILNNKFFGLKECAISTPKHLKSYFAKMPPIFKNAEVKYTDISEATKQQVKSNYKSRELIGSYFGKKMRTC